MHPFETVRAGAACSRRNRSVALPDPAACAAACAQAVAAPCDARCALMYMWRGSSPRTSGGPQFAADFLADALPSPPVNMWWGSTSKGTQSAADFLADARPKTPTPRLQVFLKASWHVGEPFVERYSSWALAQVCMAAERASLLLHSCGLWAGQGGRQGRGFSLHSAAAGRGPQRSGLHPLNLTVHQLPSKALPALAPVQAAGRDTTGGSFDEPMYRYAISPEAQESHHVEDCYRVLH